MTHEKPSHDEIIQALLGVAPYATIAHHVAGRVRLKLSLSGVGFLRETDLGNMVKQIPGIRSVRINPAALSAVVEYDPGSVDPGLWENLVRLKTHPELVSEVAGRIRSLWR